METVLNTIICLPLMSQSHYESNYSSFSVCVYGVFIICICLNPLPGGEYMAYKDKGIQPQLSGWEQRKKQNQSFADDPARKQ